MFTIRKEGPYPINWNPQVSWGDRLDSAGQKFYGNQLFRTAGVDEAAIAVQQGIGLQTASVSICTLEHNIGDYPDTLEVLQALRDLDEGSYQFADRRVLLEMVIAYPEVFLYRPPVLGAGNPLIDKKETRFAAGWAGRKILPDLSGYGEEVFSLFAQISSYPFPTGNYRYALVA